MKNIIIYLIGFPGVGKLTIARELSTRMNARIVDNHLINNPILQLVNTKNDAPISQAVWHKIAEIREIVLCGVEELTDPDLNLIFTNALMASDPEDVRIYQRVEKAAHKRKSVLVPVRLLCDIDELCKRVVSEGRAEKFKLTSAHVLAERFKNDNVYQPAHRYTQSIDVTRLSAQQVAQRILELINTLQDIH